MDLNSRVFARHSGWPALAKGSTSRALAAIDVNAPCVLTAVSALSVAERSPTSHALGLLAWNGFCLRELSKSVGRLVLFSSVLPTLRPTIRAQRSPGKPLVGASAYLRERPSIEKAPERFPRPAALASVHPNVSIGVEPRDGGTSRSLGHPPSGASAYLHNPLKLPRFLDGSLKGMCRELISGVMTERGSGQERGADRGDRRPLRLLSPAPGGGETKA